jgi:hypothetical protein
MNSLGHEGLHRRRALTYPSAAAAGPARLRLRPRHEAGGLQVPRGRIWWRMSDHLPLIAEFKL